MKWMIPILMVCSFANAQVTTDEAQKQLQEKQAARQQAREKVVTIKQGQLDDLRAEVVVLRSQLAKVQADLKVATAPKKVPTAKAAAIPATSPWALKLHQGQTLKELQAAFGVGVITLFGDGSKAARWSTGIDLTDSPDGKCNRRNIQARFSPDDILIDFEDQYDLVSAPQPQIHIRNHR